MRMSVQAVTVATGMLNGGVIELTLVAPPKATGPAEAADESEPALEPGPGVLDALLLEVDAAARADAPATAPAFDPHAARWGLAQLTHLCESLAHRDAERDVVAQASTEVYRSGSVDGRLPSHIWSADLSLRFVYGLRNQIRGFVADDPVQSAVARLAEDWPLSGVGLLGSRAKSPAKIPKELGVDRCLRGLLIDRVIERRDVLIAQVPWVERGVIDAVGARPDWLANPETL